MSGVHMTCGCDDGWCVGERRGVRGIKCMAVEFEAGFAERVNT